MFDRFSESARKCMSEARRVALAWRHDTIGTEHILLGLLNAGRCTAVSALLNLGVPTDALRAHATRAMEEGTGVLPERAQLPFTPRAKTVLELSLEDASSRNDGHIGTDHLLIGLFRETEGIAAQAMRACGLDLDSLRSAVVAARAARAAPEPPPAPPEPPPPPRSKTPALDAFSLPVAEPRDGLLPLVGREEELERLRAILLRREHPHAAIVGQPGTGKSALVRETARLASALEPALRTEGLRVVAIRIGLLLAGTKYRGQFEERVEAMISESRKVGNVIWCVDDLSMALSVAKTPDIATLSFGEMLRGGLEGGIPRCIAVTTPRGWERVQNEDPVLGRRFQPLRLRPATRGETRAVLESLRPGLEEHHGVLFAADALDAAAEAAPEPNLPGAAVDLLDGAGARGRLRASSAPDATRATIGAAEVRAVAH